MKTLLFFTLLIFSSGFSFGQETAKAPTFEYKVESPQLVLHTRMKQTKQKSLYFELGGSGGFGSFNFEWNFMTRNSVWYYIEGEQELDWLFLLDLEEQTAIGAGPGMRVANVGTGNYGTVEFKFREGNLEQHVHSFPRNQWFKITLETYLSQKKKGWVRLYLDNALIIEEKDTRTLPKDVLYNLQGTKGMYSSIEIGITANSFSNACVLYADDFSIEVIN